MESPPTVLVTLLGMLTIAAPSSAFTKTPAEGLLDRLGGNIVTASLPAAVVLPEPPLFAASEVLLPDSLFGVGAAEDTVVGTVVVTVTVLIETGEDGAIAAGLVTVTVVGATGDDEATAAGLVTVTVVGTTGEDEAAIPEAEEIGEAAA